MNKEIFAPKIDRIEAMQQLRSCQNLGIDISVFLIACGITEEELYNHFHPQTE